MPSGEKILSNTSFRGKRSSNGLEIERRISTNKESLTDLQYHVPGNRAPNGRLRVSIGMKNGRRLPVCMLFDLAVSVNHEI